MRKDKDLNKVPQKETPTQPTRTVEEVPNIWEAITILGRALLLYILIEVLYLIIGEIIKLPKDLNVIITEAFGVIILFLILKWTYKAGYNIEKTFRIFTFPRKCILPVLVLGISLSLIQFHISTILEVSSNAKPLENPINNHFYLTIFLRYIFPILISMTVVPITEEFIYRGVLLSSVEKQWGLKAAIIITSVLFGILHFKFVNSISIALSSMLVAWLVYRTNSIICGILIHCLHNAITLIYGILYFSGILDDYKFFSMVYPWSFGIIVLLVYMAIVIIGVWWFKKVLNLSSQRPITFISDYFRQTNESNQDLLNLSETGK